MGRYVNCLALLPQALPGPAGDLAANFTNAGAQGPQAYVSQMLVDHPDLDRATLAADAVVAVGEFCGALAAG